MSKKVPVLIPICIIFSVLYIIFSARPLSKELTFRPEWSIDASRIVKSTQETSEEEFKNAIPFRTAQNAGYFTSSGKILTLFSFPYKTAISSKFYAPYTTNTAAIDFFNADGSKAGTIAQTGFPFFSENGQYLFLPGGSSFASIANSGEIQWTYDGSCPITAFATSKSGCAVGYADGEIVTFDNDGEISQEFNPGGSNYPVILGLAISDSGKYTACVTGQESQRFVLSVKNGSHTEVLFHTYLSSSVTRQVPVLFSRSERSVFYHWAEGIGIVELPDGKHSQIKIPGKILSIKEGSDSTIYVLSRLADTCTISVIQHPGTLAGSFSFTASNAFIAVQDENLYIGRDNTISKLLIERK